MQQAEKLNLDKSKLFSVPARRHEPRYQRQLDWKRSRVERSSKQRRDRWRSERDLPASLLQANANVPPSANPGGSAGRGVPDVAGDADPQTGYQVQVDGSQFVVGGTSAVAPLWAGWSHC